MNLESSLQEISKIVVRFKNGIIFKGVTHDFVPEKAKFHLEHIDGKIEEIDVESLEAIFFVKTFVGNKTHEDKKGFQHLDPRSLRGLKIKVTFTDNETIFGSTLGYNKQRKGFFVIPTDPDSNNARIYVVASSVRDVKLGSQFEK